MDDIFDDYDKYREKASQHAKVEYRQYLRITKEQFRTLSSMNITIDHIFPCRKGFEMRIPIHIISDIQNLRLIPSIDNSIKSDKIDHIPPFIQSYILGNIDELLKIQNKEKQKKGIKIAKENGLYKGRVKGSNEGIESFLSKEKNKQAIEYLRQGMKCVDISKLTGLHINTLTKIKKIIKQQDKSQS